MSHRLSLAVFVKDRFECVIALPKSPLNKKIRELGFVVREYEITRSGNNPWAELRTLKALIRIIKIEKPDICHNFTVKPVIYGTLAARWMRVPQVFNTITGLGYVFISKGWKGRILRFLIKSLYRLALKGARVHTIFQNSDDLSLVSGFAKLKNPRTSLVPGSGVNPERFFALEGACNGEEIRVLAPGRMLWEKGFGDLVEAFRMLIHDPSIKLILAGRFDPDNPGAIPLSTLELWNKLPNVQWHGHVEDINALYNDSHIVCLPSYREGLPLALLEASLCKKPLITTNAPGCREVVTHRKNGLIVEPHSPKQLKNAILELSLDGELRQKLGLKAFEITQKKYICNVINQKIVDLYEQT